MHDQPPLFEFEDTAYPECLRWMHNRYGTVKGQTCGDCDNYSGRTCYSSGQDAEWSESWPACGVWRARL